MGFWAWQESIDLAAMETPQRVQMNRNAELG